MITLLNDVFKQLKLKNKNFETFEAALELDINTLWNSILLLNQILTKENKSQANIKNKVIVYLNNNL